MNFSKKPRNQQQTEKFYKSSALNLQLGLLLALLLVYIGLEFTSAKNIVQLPDHIPDEPAAYVFDAPSKIVIEKPKEEAKKPEKRKTELKDDFKLTDKPTEILEPTDLLTDETPPVSIDSIVEYVEKEDIRKDFDFILVEEAPVFPGCENLDKKSGKRMFYAKNKNIRK